MDEISKKWLPVLRKCKEFSEDHYTVVARMLENQYQHWVDESLDNLADFTRFALPVSRRVLGRLVREGYEINTVGPDIGEEFESFPMATLTTTELEIASKALLGIDREAHLCDIIADLMMEEIKKKVPSKKIDLYMLMLTAPDLPIPLQNDGEKRYILGKLRESK